MGPVFVSWAEHCSRSDALAQELGASSHMVYSGRWGSQPATVWLKYLVQMWATVRLLHREKAQVAYAMTPPVFAGLTLLVYSRFRPLKYVIDVHTAALLMPRWRRLQWLQRLVCKHAATTLVTNEHLAGLIAAGGGHTTLVRDVPVAYPKSQAYANPKRFSVAVVCSFNYDEPIGTIFEAARRLPDVQFYLSGDHRKLAANIKALCPPNATLTGFLSNADFGSLIGHSHAVMSLTTRDHTMLRGAYEAIYHGTPTIVSDFALLRQAFDEGSVHVRARAKDIAAGIVRMQTQYPTLRAGAAALRLRKLAAWGQAKQQILERLA